jgi:hypothetical protein
MAFDFVDWLVSGSFTYITSKAGSIFDSKDIQSKLNKEVDKWTRNLPGYCKLVSVAMYLNTDDPLHDDKSSLRIIGQTIDKGELPDEQLIFAALYERWRQCQRISNKQPFFNLEDAEAKEHLMDLAVNLNGVLIQEAKLFNRFVQQNLGGIMNNTEDIKVRLEILERLIKESENKQKPEPKVFRSIPKCEMIIPAEPEIQKPVTISFLKIPLFQNFRDIKYKKFTCLLNYSEDLFENGDKEPNPGITLTTGEVTFLGSCIKLVSLFCNRDERFGEIVEEYYNNDEYNSINLKLQLLKAPGLIPYEVEVDGQNKTYTIKPVPHGTLDYENLHSLNAVLPFVAAMTRPGIHIIEFDKLEKYPAVLKLVHKAIIEDSIDLSLIEVNVEDFDDWNYKYTIEKN